ncbi:mitochondrial ribosomal protein L1 [Dermatophagoides farinae]|uniref:Mitochondrial 54S ribosomal protein mrpl1 n=1 Tax=Dermatophagoides farinae TaxID=6954 RepID=A0A922IGJ9_DERFA|nr:mitochondrial 54S ribosomal protein mrpl1 [Dermatophagoides farinae]
MAFLLQCCFQSYTRNALYRLSPISSSILNIDSNNLFTSQKRYAARKGKRIAATREKQKLARLRRMEQKVEPPKEWKPQKLSVDKSLKAVSKKFNDADRKRLSEIVDNVIVMDQYKERKYPFTEVMAMIRETHQPELYGEPDALVEARIDLDLRTKKKTKFVNRFTGIVSYPNLFQFAIKRKVIALCKTDEDEEQARKAGAELAGSSDIIRMLKVGDITLDNFDDLVCHGDMLIELNTIRGMVGNYFPTKQRGNIGFDMERLVRYFINGIEYKMIKDDIEPDYGFVRIPFGRLNQNDAELEENFQCLLKAIDSNRPGQGVTFDFITRILISSEPSPEKFPITFWNHIDDYEDPTAEDNDDDDEEMKKQKATNK